MKKLITGYVDSEKWRSLLQAVWTAWHVWKCLMALWQTRLDPWRTSQNGIMQLWRRRMCLSACDFSNFCTKSPRLLPRYSFHYQIRSFIHPKDSYMWKCVPQAPFFSPWGIMKNMKLGFLISWEPTVCVHTHTYTHKHSTSMTCSIHVPVCLCMQVYICTSVYIQTTHIHSHT